MFVKTVPIAKAIEETEFQFLASKYGFSPRLLGGYEKEGLMYIEMEEVIGDTIGDEYGEDPEETPEWIWDDIRNMVVTLYEQEGIEYIDINPYNFIESIDGKIHMIDFGDAKYTNGTPDWFLTEFMDGENSWNPDYK